jgi:glycosyltransferase involved in cell wall biosynthesis
MSKPRLLYICGQAPWRQNRRSLTRNYWMIEALSEMYAIDLVTADVAHRVPADFGAKVDDYASFPRSPSHSSGVGRIKRAVSRDGSSLTAGWTNSALRDYVAERVGRHPYAAIQLDLQMQAALPRRDAIPIIYNAHNCESTLARRRAAMEQTYLTPLLRLDSLKVRAIERQLINRSSLVLASNEEDVRDFEDIVPAMRYKVAIVPDGVDNARYATTRETVPRPNTVVITGPMDQRPNQAGLRWFLRAILPRLRDAVPDVIVRVAAPLTPPLIEELRTFANTEICPDEESIVDHLSTAAVVAFPLISSGGPSSLILEAWAAGRPVITTGAGAYGIDSEDGRELLVREHPAAFAAGIVRLLNEPALRDELITNGSRRAHAVDWHLIGKQLRDVYARRLGTEKIGQVNVISEEIAFSGKS